MVVDNKVDIGVRNNATWTLGELAMRPTTSQLVRDVAKRAAYVLSDLLAHSGGYVGVGSNVCVVVLLLGTWRCVNQFVQRGCSRGCPDHSSTPVFRRVRTVM